MRRILCVLVLSTLSSLCFAQSKPSWIDIFKPKSSTNALSEDKISAGLKEALQIGTANAVSLTGRPDGFLKNEAIKIFLPERLRTVGRGMRMIGMGAQVDELEVGMNRAAEQATPQAKAIFLAALKKMSIQDARQILSGNDTAATDYFKRASSDELAAAFTPIVHDSLSKLGVVKKYNSIVQGAPGGAALAKNFDLDNYVVGKTLDGLFLMLGREEQKIRKDPAAQTTALLRTVFGQR